MIYEGARADRAPRLRCSFLFMPAIDLERAALERLEGSCRRYPRPTEAHGGSVLFCTKRCDDRTVTSQDFAIASLDWAERWCH